MRPTSTDRASPTAVTTQLRFDRWLRKTITSKEARKPRLQGLSSHATGSPEAATSPLPVPRGRVPAPAAPCAGLGRVRCWMRGSALRLCAQDELSRGQSRGDATLSSAAEIPAASRCKRERLRGALTGDRGCPASLCGREVWRDSTQVRGVGSSAKRTKPLRTLAYFVNCIPVPKPSPSATLRQNSALCLLAFPGSGSPRHSLWPITRGRRPAAFCFALRGCLIRNRCAGAG